MPRKTPVLLRPAPLSGGVMALTRYSWRNGGQMLVAATGGKHDVTADFDAIVMRTLLDPDSPNIVGILDGVADGAVLAADERAEVRAFRERLRAMVERHNESLDRAAKMTPTQELSS
jgi:hypothetical protein